MGARAVPAIVLDAGPLISVERGGIEGRALNQTFGGEDGEIFVPTVVVAEVWRGGRQSARVARLLGAFLLVKLEPRTARLAGELLAGVGGNATIDAIVVATAAGLGCPVVTSDPDDLGPLGLAAGVQIESYA